MASFIGTDKDAASFQRRLRREREKGRERNFSVPEKEGKRRREERILRLVRRQTQRERDASVWVAKRDRRLRSYWDPVIPQRHQKCTNVPHTHTYSANTRSVVTQQYSQHKARENNKMSFVTVSFSFHIPILYLFEAWKCETMAWPQRKLFTLLFHYIMEAKQRQRLKSQNGHSLYL